MPRPSTPPRFETSHAPWRSFTRSIVAVAVVLAMSACAVAVPIEVPDSKATAAVVAVEHRRDRLRYLGTGTVIGKGADATYVLTAGHVVSGRGATRVLAATADGAAPAWRAARVLACRCALEVGDVVSGAGVPSGMGDYAVLALAGGPAAGGLALSARDPAWGAEARVETLDHDSADALAPLRVPLDLRPLGPDNPFLLGVPLAGEISAGMSGSPVLADGRLVAMLVAIADSDPPRRPVSGATSGRYAVLIRATSIARFLEAEGLGWLVETGPTAPPSGVPQQHGMLGARR